MIIQNIIMEDDDDIEALRLAALQTIRPRISSKRNLITKGISYQRQLDLGRNGPFIRPINNPNLIAIVPTDLPPVTKEPIKPKVVSPKIQDRFANRYIGKAKVQEKFEETVEKKSERKNMPNEFSFGNSAVLDNKKSDSKVDSTSMFDLEEDVLDFETESVAGSDEEQDQDLLQLHDSDSDSLEKLMECIEKELNTTPTVAQPKALPRFKSKPGSDLSKPPDPTINKQNEHQLNRQKSPITMTSNKRSPPRSNLTNSQRSPPIKVDNSKLSNQKSYDRLSPARRRYSPPKQRLKQSPPHRLHSPRRSPLQRRRSPSPRKRSITPRKRSITPRKRSLTPRKRSLSPRRRSLSPRNRSITPRKRSRSPNKRSLTPRLRSLTPRKRSLTPRKRSISPRSRALTPRKRSITPRKRSLSPRGRSRTPRKLSLSPRKRSLSPRKRSLSPRKRSLSPRRRSMSPRRLSPRRRSISPRRRSPRRRSISPRRRSPSLRRRSISPWRRSISPRRSPRRRTPTPPKKRSITPRRRSISPKKRSPSPKKRSLTPRKRSQSPRHDIPLKKKRLMSPVSVKRNKRLPSLENRRLWNRSKPATVANTSTRQNNSSKGPYITRTNSNKNLKDVNKKSNRVGLKEIRSKEKVREEDTNNEQAEKNDDSQPLDPKLEARKRKFENNYVVESVNKKIWLKSERDSDRENSRFVGDPQEIVHRNRVKRKRIILDEKKSNKDTKQEIQRPLITKETPQPSKSVAITKKSDDKKKHNDDDITVKKKTRGIAKDEPNTKKGVDLRTELSRRRAERLKVAPIDPMARIVQSALEGVVGKIKSKSTKSRAATPPSDTDAPAAPEKRSKLKGRRVHVVDNHGGKSSKSEDKKHGGDEKNVPLYVIPASVSPLRYPSSPTYRSTSPEYNYTWSNSILRRKQV